MEPWEVYNEIGSHGKLYYIEDKNTKLVWDKWWKRRNIIFLFPKIKNLILF